MGDIAYAQSGETQVAYRVIGEAGRVDVVVVAGALFPFELLAEDRVASRFTTGLASLGRVVVFDKRGWDCPIRSRIGRAVCKSSGRRIFSR